jgi:hypothetical protein
LWTVASLAAGGVTFLPWLPTLAYQSAHTGTPWGEAFRPAAVAVVTAMDFAGGALAESQALSYVLVFLIVVAIFAKASPRSITLAAPPNPGAATLALLAALTLALGWAAAFASGSTYASRYAAVVFPLFALLVAAGLRLLSGLTRAVFAGIVLAGSLLGIGNEIASSRSQSDMASTAIAQRLDKDGRTAEEVLVVTCPDQLAVSLVRATDGAYQTVAFPDVDRDPRFVDWVDYADRNEAADPGRFVAEVLELAGDRPILLATNLTYRTLETKCAQVASLLQATRPPETIVQGDGTEFYESMSVLYFAPSAG